MKARFYIGLIICIIGIAAIGYSIHAMGRIRRAKGDVEGIKSFLPGESKDVVGGFLDKEASQYDEEVRYLFIGGVVLAAGGAVMAFYYRKKR